MVEVMGLEPTTSTLRTYARRSALYVDDTRPLVLMVSTNPPTPTHDYERRRRCHPCAIEHGVPLPPSQLAHLTGGSAEADVRVVGR